MPGLLDPTGAALVALGGGMVRGDFGGGLLSASNALTETQNNALKQQYIQAQMADMAQQAELRRAQVAQMQREAQLQQSVLAPILARMNGGGASSGPAIPATPGGQLGSGTFGSSVGGQAAFGGGGGGGVVGSLTPDDLFALKVGGKIDATDIYKLTQPDMQVSNGYAYDKRRVQPGFLPQLNVSQDGKTSMVQIDQNGMPVVSAPQGALPTFANYQRVQEGAKAALDPMTFTPAGSNNPVIRSRLNVIQESNATPEPGVRGAFTGDPAQVSDAIAGIKDPQERANAQAAFEAQMRQTGGKLPAPGGGVALADPAQQEARKEQLVQGAKDIAEQRKSIMNAGFVAPSNIAKYQQIGKLLSDVDGGKYTPAGTEFASALNGFGIKIDKNLPNKQAAMALANEAALQLRNPAGGAGMPGALSDADRAFLASMTPNIAQSAEGRKKVIDSYVAVQQRNQQVAQFARNYEKKYGKLDNGFFDQLQSWSNSNPLFKGQ